MAVHLRANLRKFDLYIIVFCTSYIVTRIPIIVVIVLQYVINY